MSDTTQTLGKYQIIREIARSNDIVYEAYDPVMNRRVALKELAMPGGLNDAQKEDRRNRFLREAKAAGSLSHPNIVTVYEYGEESGRHYIAMEYLDGHTLRNEVDTHGFLPLDRCLEIAKAVLEALDYAHKAGVIHRDIKPDNIQLLADGRIKITDFGIARLTFEPNLTMDGQVFGTPSYMSPEQVVGREIDARSDLFSLGVVLYEMIAGKKPFAGDSVVSITYAIMNAEPSQPPQANYAIWQVLQRVLDKSPALRYSGANELKRALEDAEAASFSSSPVLDPGQAAGMAAGYPPLPTYNPYGAPNPYAAGPQFQVGNAPPVGNPYVNVPYTVAGPPPSYPYNPYQSQPLPPMPSGSPGYPPIPVYYPPPPRPPLITPEMKSVTGKIFIAFLVLGTLVLLGVFAANYFSQAWSRMETERVVPIQDRPTDGNAVDNPRDATSGRTSESAPPIAESSNPPSNRPLNNLDIEEGRRLIAQGEAAFNAGRRADARDAFYSARMVLPVGSEEYEVVTRWIDYLTN
ncbi:MAG TPA: serine/threonine-protein kinase [Fimbriimonadaceae bacterium]|nr:serine/threonine-protein kinase [Fimbriimonadaceae bacterium]